MLKVLALISALVGAVPQPVAPLKSALPFIEDDYAKALAEARIRQVPIFVEAWAPW